MNLNIPVKMHVHNRFDLQLVDSTTGKVKQTAKAENVVLNSFWDNFNSSNYLLDYLRLGTGAGVPAATDTALFRQAFSIDVGLWTATYAYPTSQATIVVTIPATSSYVGSLTEIGWGLYASTGLVTHAMLTDSENNPITIEKTELDILIVTSTVYCTLSSSVDGFHWVEPRNNAILNWVLGGSRYAPAAVTTYIRLNCQAPDTNGIIQQNTASPASANVTSTWDASTKTLTCVGNRIGTGDSNFGFFNSMFLLGFGGMQFPDVSIFPNYTMQGLPVGTGDGTTTAFKVPIGLFVENTDVVYKNGVALTRGVDYTIEHNSNPDKLSCISEGNFGTIISNGVETTSRSAYAPFKSNASVETSAPKEYLIDRFSPLDVDLGYSTLCNFLNCRLACESSSSSMSASITVLCSDDATNWTELATTDTYTIRSSTSSPSVTLAFSGVGRYWRIRLNTTASAICFAPVTNAIVLGYTNPTGLVFTEAPATGDVLTMDCKIDRPYKSENYVIDTSMTLQFS